jgi:hypothetical protein
MAASGLYAFREAIFKEFVYGARKGKGRKVLRMEGCMPCFTPVLCK